MQAPPDTIVGEIEVNGTTLQYDITGEGHPLVLIHGGFLDRRMWDDQLPAFARRYKVIRVNLRGFQGGQPPEEPFSYVDDLYRLLSGLDTGPVYLLGLSLGAMTATDFTTSHPEMVDALILAGAPLRGIDTGDPEGSQAKISEVIRTYRRGEVDSAIALTLKMPIFRPAEENPLAAQRMAEMIRDNFGNWLQSVPFIRWDSTTSAERVSEIGIPTLVIVGDKDIQSILFAADSLTDRIPNSEKVVIAGASHHINMDAPEAFDAAVLRFLDKMQDAP